MISQEKLSELYSIYSRHPKVVTDSRNIVPGSIFFALKGASFDGNRFAADSLTKGSVIAVVDDPSAVPFGNGTPDHAEAVAAGYFLVDDVLTTLQALASLHRTTLGIPILAITGSNGKTTTKELTSAVLATKFRIHATQGNLNNHIGVPLTLLSMSPDTEFGIVEMGASAKREIALLCSIAKPDYGIITNVGRAHLEGFGGEDGVKTAKGELYDYLAAHGGRVFVRKEDTKLMDMASQRGGLSIIPYATVSSLGYESNLAGDYNMLNIAAAVSIGEFFGIGQEALKSAIKNYFPNANRSQTIDTGRNTIIADCYNANPSSMRAAIEWFSSYQDTDTGNRRTNKVIILGDMFELGEWSAQEHADIFKTALQTSPQQLILLGKEFCKAVDALNESTNTHIAVFESTEALTDSINSGNTTVRDCSVLLKGSRGMALERIIRLL